MDVFLKEDMLGKTLLPAAWGLRSDSAGSWPSWPGLAVTLCPPGEDGRLAFQPQLSPVPGAGRGRRLFLNGLGSRDKTRFYLKRTVNVCGFSEHPFHRSLALPFTQVPNVPVSWGRPNKSPQTAA